MIRAEGVCKSFDKKEVLTDIDAVFAQLGEDLAGGTGLETLAASVDWLALD